MVVRTNVPRWFFDQSVSKPIEFQTCEADTGVAQIDSLRLDEAETARRAASFYAEFHRRAAAEATILRTIKPDVVIADVPPLGVAAAHLADIPSVVLANFTWDWIYAAYPDFELLAPGVVDVIRKAYSTTTRALRLPLHGGFEPMAQVTRDIPLVARQSQHGRDAVRRVLGLGGTTPVVLASFGRYGLDLPYRKIARDNAFSLIVTEPENRDQPPSATPGDRLVRLSQGTLEARGLKYEDLVAAADVVVSKPGYGIVSECIANDTALLYTSRGHFIEHDVLVREMPRLLPCRHITQHDLLAGRWSSGISALLREPRMVARPSCHGADVAADEIADVAEGTRVDQSAWARTRSSATDQK